MMTALLDAIAAIQATLEAAVQATISGGAIDLSGLDRALDQICADARTLAADQPQTRDTLAAALGGLAVTLDHLATAMGGPPEGGATAARVQALAAYRRPSEGA